MSTEAYVRDKRFEPHGCAIWFPTCDHQAEWIPLDRLVPELEGMPWDDIFLICHHTQFDGLVLSHHFRARPRMYGCTLSMARLLLGNHLSVSLDSVRKQFGIPAKVTPYNQFEGKRWHELTPQVQKLVGDGAVDEVQSIWKIFNILLKDFPPEELSVVDTVVSMFADPVLRADTNMLGQLWSDEELHKTNAMNAIGVTETELQSADKFAELLRAEGVEPETKTSPKGKEIFAFAKTDQFMRDLLEDDNPRVRGLAEARLGVKSTLQQTRAETLGWMASRGPLPVYLRYAGAGTLRVSGGDGCLTADTQILTLDVSGSPRYKNIVDVQISDLVWDGEEFVAHDGVAFMGYQKVISWNGLNGTPEHPVFCGEAWCSLSEALQSKTPVLDCREPTAWEVEAARTRRQASAVGAVPMRMQYKKNGSSKRSPGGKI